jgi:hypothetical protein
MADIIDNTDDLNTSVNDIIERAKKKYCVTATTKS